jgi:striatin 1/3/4
MQLFDSCRNASLDVEPLYTFRSHTGPVLCLVMSSSGEQLYSSSQDGTIKAWNLPSSNIDPYDSFGMLDVMHILN